MVRDTRKMSTDHFSKICVKESNGDIIFGLRLAAENQHSAIYDNRKSNYNVKRIKDCKCEWKTESKTMIAPSAEDFISGLERL